MSLGTRPFRAPVLPPPEPQAPYKCMPRREERCIARTPRSYRCALSPDVREPGPAVQRTYPTPTPSFTRPTTLPKVITHVHTHQPQRGTTTTTTTLYAPNRQAQPHADTEKSGNAKCTAPHEVSRPSPKVWTTRRGRFVATAANENEGSPGVTPRTARRTSAVSEAPATTHPDRRRPASECTEDLPNSAHSLISHETDIATLKLVR